MNTEVKESYWVLGSLTGDQWITEDGHGFFYTGFLEDASTFYSCGEVLVAVRSIAEQCRARNEDMAPYTAWRISARGKMADPNEDLKSGMDKILADEVCNQMYGEQGLQELSPRDIFEIDSKQ